MIAMDYGAVRLAHGIVMPDVPERFPAEIDWTGPRQLPCEVKRALLIYRYRACHYLSYNKLLADRSVALEYLAPRSLFDFWRLIYTFAYAAGEPALQKRLKLNKYLDQETTDD